MPQTTVHYFLIVFVVLFLGLTALLVWGHLAPIVLGVMLATLGYGWQAKLANKLKHPNLAALVSLLLIVAIIVVPATALFILLTREAISLAAHLERIEVLRAVDIATAKLAIIPGLADFIDQQLVPGLKSIGAAFSQNLGRIFGSALRFVIGFFVMLVTAFYFLRDGKRFGDAMMALSPLKSADELNLFSTFREALHAVLVSNLVSALAQGALGALGFWIFGLPAPLFWGTLMAFFALIPLLGPYLVFIPSTLYLFLVGNPVPAVFFLVYNIVLVSSVDNVIKPKLISGKIKVHPLLVLISILGGIKTFGILGVLYGPLIVSMLLALLTMYLRSVQKETLLAREP